MDRSITYCTNAVNWSCKPITYSDSRGCCTTCECADNCSITYGNAPYYNNQVMTNFITCIGGLTNCCDGPLFNCVCVNTNFSCSYVLAQILGCWPNNTALSTANSPEYLASCVGLGGINCLVGTCIGCAKTEGEVYRAFYCVSDSYPAVKVELTWTFVSNDYSTCNGSGSTGCACYGYKRQMVSTWCTSCNVWSPYDGWKTCCYLVYPGQCVFNCSIFNTGGTTAFIHPFNPRHNSDACACNNYGYGSGGLGIIRFAVYRHKDGRSVSTAASRNCLACYTCPILKFYPFTQPGCSTINGLPLDTATCTCGFYYYGGCCGKLLGGSCCYIGSPTIDLGLAGTYYAPWGGWAIPMATWHYVCDATGYMCYRNFTIGGPTAIRSTFRNATVSAFEEPTCKAAAMCQLWRFYTSGTNSWRTNYCMGNSRNYGDAIQLLMPIIVCQDSWTIDPAINDCFRYDRVRTGRNYTLLGTNCKSGPGLYSCTKCVCLRRGSACCGAINSATGYELAMGQCKQRTAVMYGSSTLPVTDQNGCYILGLDGVNKCIVYTGSATCCKPLIWKRYLGFYSAGTGFPWPSNFTV